MVSRCGSTRPCPPAHGVQDAKRTRANDNRVDRVPHGHADRGRQEEPAPFDPHHGEGSRQRRVCGPRARPGRCSCKQPRQEIRRAHRHPQAENDAGERLLTAAFPEGEHQPADDNRDQRQASRERAGERLLQHVHGVQPRADALGEHGASTSPTASRTASAVIQCERCGCMVVSLW